MCGSTAGVGESGFSQTEQYIRTDNGRLYVRESGQGDALLLIHGVASDARYFDGAVPLLAERFHVITYDRNGHSKSVPFQQADFSACAEAHDAWRLLDMLGIGRTAIVGVSGGSRVALEMALLRPDQTGQLIMYEPPFCITTASERALTGWSETVAELTKDGNTAGALLAFVDMIGGIDSDSPEISMDQQLANYRNFCFFLERQFDYFAKNSNCGELLEQLSVPCCVMAGTQDREGLFRQTAVETARFLKTVPIFVPGYHNFPKDHPKDFAAMVMELAREPAKCNNG